MQWNGGKAFPCSRAVGKSRAVLEPRLVFNRANLAATIFSQSEVPNNKSSTIRVIFC